MTRWLRPLLGALLLTALVLPARVEAHIITPIVINQGFQIWFGDSYIRLNAFLDHGELHAPAFYAALMRPGTTMVRPRPLSLWPSAPRSVRSSWMPSICASTATGSS